MRRSDGNLGAVSLGFAGARAEYRAASSSRSRSRVRGIQPLGSGADFHIQSEARFFRLMEEARACDRDNGVVGQGINRLVDLVFRDGMLADPDTGDTQLDDLISEDWRVWGEDPDACDISGKESLHGIARLAFRASVVDGDSFPMLLDSGHIQGIEAHRCRTPRNARNDRRKMQVVHGVELDRYRRPVRYWFSKDNVGLDQVLERVSDVDKVAAYDGEGYRNVLHVYRPERFSQSRGVTALARVLETANQHEDLQWAQLVKAQVSACFAIIRELDKGTKLPTGSSALGARTSEVSTVDDFVKVLEQIAPGMILTGRPGEKISGFTANVPNAEFFKHAMMILMIVAINLGIPVIVLLLDPSATNFSGWRGAMDAAKPGLTRFRRKMVEQFYKPVYLWRVRRLLMENAVAGRLAAKAGVRPFNVEFKPPHDPYIEPLKDAEADRVIITEGLNSRRAVLASRGLDIRVVDRHRIEDRGRLLLLAHEAAVELREAGLTDVSWRDLIPSDTKSEQMIHVAQIEASTTGGEEEEGGATEGTKDTEKEEENSSDEEQDDDA